MPPKAISDQKFRNSFTTETYEHLWN